MATQNDYPLFLKIKAEEFNKLIAQIPSSYKELESIIEQFIEEQVVKHEEMPKIKLYAYSD